ncbi:MAG: response regulator [Arachnia sp.]
MPEKIRLMLVDDQELIRTGFRLVLRREASIDIVAEADDGQQALDELTRLQGACDVVLMDVRMPRLNGIDATARIVAQFPATRVLVLTTFDLDEYAHGAVQSGASGFLLKDARPTELIDAIQRVAQGDAVMAPSATRRMIEHLLRSPSSSEAHSTTAAEETPPSTAELDALTDREREVLVLIGEGLNNTEISERLYLSESTVKTHVGRILFKLELRDRIHAVILAHRLGL